MSKPFNVNYSPDKTFYPGTLKLGTTEFKSIDFTKCKIKFAAYKTSMGSSTMYYPKVTLPNGEESNIFYTFAPYDTPNILTVAPAISKDPNSCEKDKPDIDRASFNIPLFPANEKMKEGLAATKTTEDLAQLRAMHKAAKNICVPTEPKHQHFYDFMEWVRQQIHDQIFSDTATIDRHFTNAATAEGVLDAHTDKPLGAKFRNVRIGKKPDGTPITAPSFLYAPTIYVSVPYTSEKKTTTTKDIVDGAVVEMKSSKDVNVPVCHISFAKSLNRDPIADEDDLLSLKNCSGRVACTVVLRRIFVSNNLFSIRFEVVNACIYSLTKRQSAGPVQPFMFFEEEEQNTKPLDHTEMVYDDEEVYDGPVEEEAAPAPVYRPRANLNMPKAPSTYATRKPSNVSP